MTKTNKNIIDTYKLMLVFAIKNEEVLITPFAIDNTSLNITVRDIIQQCEKDKPITNETNLLLLNFINSLRIGGWID